MGKKSLSITAALLCANAFFPAAAADSTSGGLSLRNFPTFWVQARVSQDDFLSPLEGPGPITGQPGKHYVPNGAGAQQTHRLPDLTNPILKPWAVEQMQKTNDAVNAGKVPFIARERCWPVSAPGWLVFAHAAGMWAVQTEKVIYLIQELDQQVRRIYMNVPHSQNIKPSWYGESVGHFEGDELVVDTIGMNDKSFVDNYRTPHTDKLHVVERFKLIDNGGALQVTATMEDEGAFNMPFTAIQRWNLGPVRSLTEQICAENSEDFFNYDVVPIPRDDTPDF
jgi:hypothetical protein